MDPNCEVKTDTVTLSAAEWACVRSALQRLASLEYPISSYLSAHKSRRTPGGERIRNTVQLARCELRNAVERLEGEHWLRRELATLNIEDNDEEEED